MIDSIEYKILPEVHKYLHLYHKSSNTAFFAILSGLYLKDV